jgi:hypothetical protein
MVAGAAVLCQCASQGYRELPALDKAAGGAATGDDGSAPYSGDDGSILTLVNPASSGMSGNANQPSFGPTTTARVAPPPISGGTLLVTADNVRAVVSDPDRDLLYVVKLSSRTLSHTIALDPGDEPGRLVEDGAGRVHVALRGAGVLVTIDPVTGSVLARRGACPAPRGVAWDRPSNLVWVACATGELVAFPSAGGAATEAVTVERDLRDIVDTGGSLSISSFRSAQVLRLGSGAVVARRDALPSPSSRFAAHVVWRAVAGPNGTLVAVHQAQSTQSLSTTIQGGYGCSGGGFFGGGPFPPVFSSDSGLVDAGATEAGSSSDRGPFSGCHIAPDPSAPAGVVNFGPPPPPSPPSGAQVPPPPPPGGGCGPESGAVLSVLTVLGSDGTPYVNSPFAGAMPVDVAVSADGGAIAVVAPGNTFTPNLSSVFVFGSCGEPKAQVGINFVQGGSAQPIAVALDAAKNVIVQTREPATLEILTPNLSNFETVPLSAFSREDTGSDIFHTQAGALIACASCHPEGGDDGHVWLLDGKLRRTPSLRGTIAGTAPYHWPGDEQDLTVLVNDVYTKRMSGASLDIGQMTAVTGWVEKIAPPRAPAWVDLAAANRGNAIFHSIGAQCSTCHSGPKLTNNQTVDVGTGGLFQVPPLVGVGWRTPLMHDGCATTLADRFAACSSPQHGSIASLSAQDLSDLMAYLESL